MSFFTDKEIGGRELRRQKSFSERNFSQQEVFSTPAIIHYFLNVRRNTYVYN